MTLLEQSRFQAFKEQYPEAYTEYAYPSDIRYVLYAVSGDIREDITDIGFMLENL